MSKTFVTLDSALRYKIPGIFPFIVAEECNIEYIDANGDKKTRKRQFVVWKDVDTYYKNIDNNNNCHELVIPRTYDNHLIKCQGRLVFDFDIKFENIKKNFKFDNYKFKKLIENTINNVFNKYYKNVDISKFVYVWLNSENKKKISKHLIVKNCFFCQDWLSQIKQCYEFIDSEIKKDYRYHWIQSDDLIDFQLARNKASLRMPYNSKLGGSTILFEDKKTFYDGLIYPYKIEDRKKEQRINFSNCIYKYEEKKYLFDDAREIEEIYKYWNIFNTPNYNNDVFKVGKEDKCFINLIRTKPAECLISGKFHENDNAYLYIDNKNNVHFCCRRGCSKNGKKSIMISKKKEKPICFHGVKIPKF
jgi:hypothetical protein